MPGRIQAISGATATNQGGLVVYIALGTLDNRG